MVGFWNTTKELRNTVSPVLAMMDPSNVDMKILTHALLSTAQKQNSSAKMMNAAGFAKEKIFALEVITVTKMQGAKI